LPLLQLNRVFFFWGDGFIVWFFMVRRGRTLPASTGFDFFFGGIRRSQLPAFFSFASWILASMQAIFASKTAIWLTA
jgi:hypothetical protein